MCKKCVAGKEFTLTMTLCSICKAGTYQDLNDAAPAICESCPMGRYLTDTATAESEHDAYVDCLFCPKGFAFTNTTLPCAVCVRGKYQDSNVVSGAKCLACDKGTFTLDNKQACGSCPTGTFQDKVEAPEYNCRGECFINYCFD